MFQVGDLVEIVGNTYCGFFHIGETTKVIGFCKDAASVIICRPCDLKREQIYAITDLRPICASMARTVVFKTDTEVRTYRLDKRRRYDNAYKLVVVKCIK